MFQTFRAGVRSLYVAVAAAFLVTLVAPSAQAQFNNFGNNIGGVRVNPQGMLSLTPDQLDEALYRKLVAQVAENNQLFSDHDGIRKLSLRRLNEVVAQAAREGKNLPAEARFLGGLVRIEYVFVDQDRNDLILAGPADVLMADAKGNVIGQNTKLPALHLEDLMTALRTVDAATTGAGISVSIEPSEESRVAFKQITEGARQTNQVNAAMLRTLEEKMGPQNVILTGIPGDSRFANVLALADYRMKRISMGLDASPVKKLPSFVSMFARSTSVRSLTPRFWMEMNYNPVSRSEDGRVWRVSGVGAKTLTENDHVNQQGQASASGQQDPIASKWAAAMTDSFGDLVNEDQIFAELRNVFDMSVVAALIEKEGLVAASGVNVGTLVGTGEPVEMPKWNVPSQVATVASVVNGRRSEIVTASGGVQLDPWTVVSKVQVVSELSEMASQLTSKDGDSLAWN